MTGSVLRLLARRILSSTPFTKYLFVTNVVVGGAIDFCGDLLAQRVVERSDSTNWKRTCRMAAMGMVLTMPCHFWYLYLDKWFPLRTRAHVIRKVLLDGFVAGPPLLSAFFLGM
jgi:hypothetical protein